jgi:hypothetical protein
VVPPEIATLDVFPVAIVILFCARYTGFVFEVLLFTVTVKLLQTPADAHTLIIDVPLDTPKSVRTLFEIFD